MRILRVIILLLICNHIGYSQPYQIIELGAKNGFPGVIYNAMETDSKGWVWAVSSGAGVVRYNGSELFAFHKLMHNSNAVTLYIDPFDTVFAGTFSGVEAIYYDTVAYHIDLQNEYDCGPIRAITKCKDGILWAVSNKGIFFKIKNKKAEKIMLPKPYNHIPDINSIVCDNSGNIWIASYSGYLLLYEPKKSKVENLKQELNLNYEEFHEIIPTEYGMLITTPDSTLLISGRKLKNKFYTLYYGYDKKYFAGVGNDFVVAKLNESGDSVIKRFTYDIPLLDNVWFSDVLYTHNMFYLTTNKGFFEITPEVKIYDAPFLHADAIRTNNVIFHEGKVWNIGIPYGYFEKGLFYPSSFADTIPTDFRADNAYPAYGKIYFSSTSGPGFYYIDTHTNRIYYDAFLDRLRQKDPTTSIGGNKQITCIVSQGNIMIIHHTGDTLFYKITPNSNIISVSNFDTSVSDYPYVKQLFIDSHSTVWIATMKGLWYYADNKFFKAPDNLFPADFHSIVEDSTGDIWISSSGGIIHYSYADHSFRLVPGNFGSINFNRLVKLMYTPGYLYISFNQYRITKDSLIYEGNILSHRYFRDIKTLNFYDCAVDSEGDFWFPYRDKIYSIPLKHIDLRESTPKLVITKAVSYDGNRSKTLYLAHNDTLYLGSSSKVVSVFFDVLSFNTQKVQVYYRLLPNNKQWIKAPSPQIIYNSLSSGTHTLELKAINKTRYHSFATLTIIKEPLFYETLWFKLAIVVLLVGIMFLLLKINTAYVKKKEAKKRAIRQQIAELQIKALQAQMNPHFIFNTLNSIQYLLAYDKTTQAYEAIDVFSKLIRKTLEFISVNFISVNEEAEYLKLYLEVEKLRFEDHFKYKIVYQNMKDFNSPVLPPLVVQPFAENAIKHGLLNSKNPEKELVITFEQTADAIVISVKDNGIGFPGRKNDRKRQHGIDLIMEKLEIYRSQYHKNYTVTIESKPGKGTIVTLTIPI